MGGIVVAVLAGGVLFFVTQGDDVASELASSRQSAVYEIRPGDGIGPVEIGMSRAHAERAMKASGEAVDLFVRRPESPPVLAMERNAFQVSFDRADRVNGIEVNGPPTRRSEPRARAGVHRPSRRCRRLPDARETAGRGRVAPRRAGAKPVVTEFGSTVTFPALGIGLWREVVEDTPYFETVGVDPPKRPRS